MNQTLASFVRKASRALLVVASLLPLNSLAQDSDFRLHPTVDLDLQMRVDFVRTDSLGPHGSNSGFHGSILKFNLKGEVMRGLTYSFRQRLNRLDDCSSDVFGATDWVWLRYQINRSWAVSAGKEIVLIGGYEYDANPINEYFTSRFWNNIACFQFGATVAYTALKNQTISAQVTNSPYCTPGCSCYAYNLYWAGGFGAWHTLWSTNMVEYIPGHYVNYIALGNQFDLHPLTIDVDLMNRATAHHSFFGKDFTVVGKAVLAVRPWLSLMVKGGYDKFKVNPGDDASVDNPFYGGGIEVFPCKKTHNIRFHAIWDRVSDNQGQRLNQFNVGCTCILNLCDTTK